MNILRCPLQVFEFKPEEKQKNKLLRNWKITSTSNRWVSGGWPSSSKMNLANLSEPSLDRNLIILLPLYYSRLSSFPTNNIHFCLEHKDTSTMFSFSNHLMSLLKWFFLVYTLRGCLTVRSDPKKKRFMEITLLQA